MALARTQLINKPPSSRSAAGRDAQTGEYAPELAVNTFCSNQLDQETEESYAAWGAAQQFIGALSDLRNNCFGPDDLAALQPVDRYRFFFSLLLDIDELPWIGALYQKAVEEVGEVDEDEPETADIDREAAQ
jgi:hypothetical protein